MKVKLLGFFEVEGEPVQVGLMLATTIACLNKYTKDQEEKDIQQELSEIFNKLRGG